MSRAMTQDAINHDRAAQAGIRSLEQAKPSTAFESDLPQVDHRLRARMVRGYLLFLAAVAAASFFIF